MIFEQNIIYRPSGSWSQGGRSHYNGWGYDREGYDREGYDKDGYDPNGCDRDGNPRPDDSDEEESDMESEQKHFEELLRRSRESPTCRIDYMYLRFSNSTRTVDR